MQHATVSSPFMEDGKQYINASHRINRYLKAIGKELGLSVPLTHYVARHSWASAARSKNIPISVISEGMGHDSETTTRIYLGKGSPAHHSKFCDNDLVQGEVEILHTPKTTDPMDDRSVTLYDISAAANLKTLLADRPQYALGRIVIPNIPVCDGAVYVSGDSMYPILKSGDIVGFKSIRDFTDVIYGEMYLVSFERGGDEYLAVKYVNHSERPDCIRLVSYNNHHDPMDLPLAAVNAMAIVKFSIRKNMMM